MAESPEHKFLKNCTSEILKDFSTTKLYGFVESERKKFDLSCIIERDWTRPLVGQVLWRHIDGIEKDIRTLITDTDSEIKVYVASDIVSHHATFEEIITDYRYSGKGEDLFKLRPIWIPGDFDADKENQRNLIYEIVKSQIVNDILFNVVFGRLAKDDLVLFADASGTFGLQIAILHNIATEGFLNITALSKRLDISPNPIREKLQLLLGIGLIETPIASLNYTDTQKGRILLELISQVFLGLYDQEFSPELSYILDKLGLTAIKIDQADLENVNSMYNPFIRLVHHILSANETWQLGLEQIDYSNKVVLEIPNKI